MLEVDLLGPVEVRVSGVDVGLSPLERNLLTLLALSKGIALSTDRIIDQLWGDRLPAAPRSRVQGLISSLRRKIGEVLVTRHPGYLLDPSQLEVDVQQCETFAFQASAAGSTAAAVELLRRALGVWRGEPLDGVTAPGADTDRTRLAELRVGLLEARFDAELELGRDGELVAELASAVAANPLRERLAGQHMSALYRANRRADALNAYQALRTRLADELGSDPCHDLRTLHATILRGVGDEPVPTAPPPDDTKRRRGKNAPAQLPPGVGYFTGRATELRTLTDTVTEPVDEPTALVVTAAAGLGKTALVVRWAHAVADRYPDGQVFLDLRGHDPRQALTPDTALTAVLTALGTRPKKMPATLSELLSRYRTALNGRRVLIVADDAGSVSQVAPLVPPTPDSQIVVTSRRRLHGLSTQHAVRELTIEPLPHDTARELLRRILGPERLRDPALDDLLRWCGGWPLALRHVAAKLAARPSQSAAAFAEELRAVDDGLAGRLVVDGDPRSVHNVLFEALRGVSPDAGRLFDRLRRAGSGMSLPMVAAAADTPVPDARDRLDELLAAHLVVEDRSGRFHFHDLVGRFTTELAPDPTPLLRPVVNSQRI